MLTYFAILFSYHHFARHFCIGIFVYTGRICGFSIFANGSHKRRLLQCIICNPNLEMTESNWILRLLSEAYTDLHLVQNKHFTFINELSDETFLIQCTSEISFLLSLDFIDNLDFILSALCNQQKINDLDFIDNLDFIDLLLTTNYLIKSRFHCTVFLSFRVR